MYTYPSIYCYTNTWKWSKWLNRQEILDDYDDTIKASIGDYSKPLFHNHIQVDNTNKYVDNFQKIGEAHIERDLWDRYVDSIAFKHTSKEADMEQLDEYIGT